MFLQFADDQRAGKNIVQRLFLLRESRHDVTDEEDDTGNNFREEPASSATETDAVPVKIRDFQPQRLLAERRLPGGAFQKRVVEPVENRAKQRDPDHSVNKRQQSFQV